MAIHTDADAHGASQSRQTNGNAAGQSPFAANRPARPGGTTETASPSEGAQFAATGGGATRDVTAALSHWTASSGPAGGQSAALGPVDEPQAVDGTQTDPDAESEAQQGVESGGTELPHHQAIQSSFGSHDLSSVRAHTGDSAAAACDALGASAYATGNQVAFKGATDLHTAAHEAAHVVQQRGGRSLEGDAGEQHADAVADRVVAGRSAADLLPAHQAGASSAAAPAAGKVVQRKTPKKDATAEYAKSVAAAVGKDDFIGNPTGAYCILNGLGPDEMTRTVRRLSKKVQQALRDHIAEAAQGYDRPRIEVALSMVKVDKKTATQTLETVDAVHTSIDGGTTSEALARLAKVKSAQLPNVLLGMNVDQIDALLAQIEQAPADAKERLRTALTKRRKQAFADRVSEAVARGDFEGESGAFALLNGLSPAELTETLKLSGAATRKQLLSNMAQAEKSFDRPRLEQAVRTVTGGQKTAADSLSILDELREAEKSGEFGTLITKLGAMNRVQLSNVLAPLNEPSLRVLEQHVGEAPADQQQRLRDVLADIFGPPALAPKDLIDVEKLKGLDRQMAELYNTKGQFIASEADALGIGAHVAAGIMQAEAGGKAFDEQTNKPIARFEVHKFWEFWGSSNPDVFNTHFKFNHEKNQRHTGHKWREGDSGNFGDIHGDQPREWRVIEFASGLASPELAYQSSSFGAGQTMGFNHDKVGTESATAMVEKYSRSERAQITGIFQFIRQTDGVLAAVQSGDFDTLARRYNGGGNVAHYSGLIRDYSASYRRVTATLNNTAQ